ncbi:hypothetical protein NVP1101O_118 [Vibrio phage 1.101.O._10N.261.45.C6]|nr:hypothetical protein NVP1101O_118 [Vibrio phage 1.101.O._10N.261.45.C6]
MSRPTILKGDDFSIVLKVVDETSPRDITGFTDITYFISSVHDQDLKYHESSYGNGVDVIDATNGEIYVDLPESVTTSLPIGQVFHKCVLVDQSGRKTTLLGDYMNIVSEKYRMVGE